MTAPREAPRSRRVVTRMKVRASPHQVWRGLMFYEQIGPRPPLHLRLFLPIPIAAQSSHASEGDVVQCLYEEGYLLKRLTRIEPGRHYGFEVIEQHLAVGRGLELSGGCYALRDSGEGATELSVTTRYASHRRPAWLWNKLEAAVCHLFHRYLLSTIKRNTERVDTLH